MPASDNERDEEFPRGYSYRRFLADEQAAEEAAAAEPVETTDGGGIEIEWIDGTTGQEMAVLRLRDKEGHIQSEAILLGWQARQVADLLRR